MAANSKIGKIYSVYCKNFVTYDEGLLRPTEYLNIIIGPNGTGKSTLVAAIVIGLGGEPKLLSRSSAIQDYVKNGKEEAKVIVKLYCDERGGVATFQRNFNREGKSDFTVNEKIMSKDKFLKAVAAYNVQISNLCQFLPQDKVQDFAKMNAQEIFANTLKSVCQQSVIDDFEKLRALRLQQSTEQTQVGKELQKLNELTNQVENLKQVVQRFQARQEISDKLNIGKAKKLWTEVKLQRDKFQEVKARLDVLKRNLKKAESACAKLERQASAAKKASDALRAAAEEKKTKLNSIWNQLQNVAKNISESAIKIHSLKQSYKRHKSQYNDCLKELNNVKELLNISVQDLQSALNNLGVDPVATTKQQQKFYGQMNDLKEDIKRLIMERNNINSKLDDEFTGEIRFLQSRIERARNVDQQKIEILKTRFEDVYKAMCWLDENRDSLQGEVYRPILLEINITNPNHLAQIENVIAVKDLVSFACENKDDMDLLVEELVQKRKLRINVVNVDPADRVTFAPREPLSNIRKYGFTNYVIDSIRGPAPILNFLCSIYHLQNIPIGGPEVSRHVDEIPTNIQVYFSGDMRFSCTVSSYSGERSLVQFFLQSKGILGSVNEEELHLLQTKLNKLIKASDSLRNERTSIENKIKEIEYKREEVRKKKTEFEAKLTNIENTKKKIERHRENVRRLEENMGDLPRMKQELSSSVKTLAAKVLHLHREKMKIIKQYQKHLIEKTQATEKYRFHARTIEREVYDYQEKREEKDRVEKELSGVKNSVDKAAERARALQDEAKALTDNRSPDDPDFPYTKEFSELPDEPEELAEYINDYNARFNCMGDTDQEIVDEYETKCNEIEVMKQAIEEKQALSGNLEAQITGILSSWKPEIDNMISILNEHFGAFMQSMQFAGEIGLVHKEEHDFDSYGINISVQYRKETPLQTLDRCVQSGGERAVAIAVYTLSLQHLSHVPFRCVDEINQGMDPRNERKIFEMLVGETTKTGSSQYFFVTPKLLPNLTAHERMTVHIVFNGKLLERRIKF